MKRPILLLLGLLSLLGGQRAEAQQSDSTERQRLEQLRLQLLAPRVKPQGLDPDLDRLFRYEPPYPYNDTQGYHFLAAYAAGQMRSRQSETGGSGHTFRRIVELAVGRNFDFGRWTLGIDGLANLIPDRNSIDGQWLGYEVQLVRHLAPGRSVALRSSNNYTLRSRQWFSENHLLLYYAPQRAGLLVLSGGRTSRGTYHLTPEEIYRGYYPSLQLGNGPMRAYSKDFVSLRNGLGFLEGQLHLTTALSWEDRRPQVELPLQHHRRFGYSTQLLLAPQALNRTAAGELLPIGYRRELGLSYEQATGLGALDRSAVPYLRYQQLELFARGSFALGRGQLDFTALVGKRWDEELLDSGEARYFEQLSDLGRVPFRYAWATMPIDFTGGDAWASQSVNYLGRDFFLTRSRGLGEVLRLDEAFHFKAVETRDGRSYLEGGYSLGWGDMARLGLFVGHELQRSKTRLALRLSLPILCLSSSWSERR